MLTSIAVTSFDGAQEGVLSGAIRWTFERCSDIGFSLPDSFRIANSIWLLITLAVVSGLYWLGVTGMHTVRGSPPVKELGRSFAHSLIPIALAYLVAHYFSAFLYQEQAQFTYILSDPLGHGSDLFGTAGGGINYGIVGSNTVWYVQVAALVIGHVVALTLAHDRALAVYDNVRHASRSQYFMLAVMVGFTCFGLCSCLQSSRAATRPRLMAKPSNHWRQPLDRGEALRLQSACLQDEDDVRGLEAEQPARAAAGFELRRRRLRYPPYDVRASRRCPAALGPAVSPARRVRGEASTA